MVFQEHNTEFQSELLIIKFFFSPLVSALSNVSSTDKQAHPFSTNSLPANQMHPDNKLANHGKQVTNDSRSQIPSVNQQAQQQQGSTSHLGPKNTGAGSHGIKANQISSCNTGLKAVSQSVGTAGGMLKTKSKRERSVTSDSSESRNALPPAQETDAKGGKACMHREKYVSIWDIETGFICCKYAQVHLI